MSKQLRYVFACLCYLLTGCGIASYFDEDISFIQNKTRVHSEPNSGNGYQKPIEQTPESRRESLQKTFEGFILLVGWEQAVDYGYDTSKLTKEEKLFYIDCGIEKIKQESKLKKFSKIDPAILAHYYQSIQEHKKSMYWAFKGAENGSPDCMGFLSDSYRAGVGVVQDFAEGIKWTYLAAAAGDYYSKKWLKDNGVSLMMDEHSAHIMKEAQRRATEWLNQHQDIFISCD